MSDFIEHVASKSLKKKKKKTKRQVDCKTSTWRLTQYPVDNCSNLIEQAGVVIELGLQHPIEIG
jgi:hypothetical protein